MSFHAIVQDGVVYVVPASLEVPVSRRNAVVSCVLVGTWDSVPAAQVALPAPVVEAPAEAPAAPVEAPAAPVEAPAAPVEVPPAAPAPAPVEAPVEPPPAKRRKD